MASRWQRYAHRTLFALSIGCVLALTINSAHGG